MVTGAESLCGDIPRQVGGSNKDRRVDVRLRFPHGPALHNKEHLGTLDRDFGDFTLVNDDLLVKVVDKKL